ncbi:hypothetical protein AMTRI_Chr07g80360 [Amborella trichopoda]
MIFLFYYCFTTPSLLLALYKHSYENATIGICHCFVPLTYPATLFNANLFYKD